jgi:hypothetical protein
LNELSVIFISTPRIKWMKAPWVYRFFRSPFGIKLSSKKHELIEMFEKPTKMFFDCSEARFFSKKQSLIVMLLAFIILRVFLLAKF